MKRILLVTGICLMTLNAFSQNKEEIEAEGVPAVVVTTLSNKFPSTIVKKWHKGDDNYEANFKKDKKNIKLLYLREGSGKKRNTL